jgi:hypothetical protein
MFSESRNHYLVAVVSLLAAVFFIHQAITFEKSYPKYKDLIYSEGELAGRVSTSRHSFRFSLSNSDGEFQFLSKSGKLITVRDLVNSGRGVKVGYIEDDNAPKTVYDLEIDGRKVRTYEEIRAAHESDNKWVFFLVPFLIFGALYSFMIARRN